MKRALLIEDDRVAALVAIVALRSAGLAVERVRSARGARAAWRLGAFALVVADIQIPEAETDSTDASGLEFVAWMRARGERARVVVWSAGELAPHRLRAAEVNATLLPKDGAAQAALLFEASRV